MRSRVASLLAGLLVLLTSSGCAVLRTGPDPARVHPDLVTVATSGEHRLLVYRECSDASCWNHTWLQWIGGWPSEVRASVSVAELERGVIVGNARWTQSDDGWRAEVRVLPAVPGPDPYQLDIVPGAPGQYTATRR